MTESQLNNLDCQDIKAILSGLVDDEVDSATRHAAERHMAECKPCRDLLTQAESLNELVALDAQRNLWPVGLPAGFEDAVLSRTVYGDAYQFAGRQWTSWLGWVAAAACLLLSLSIWFLDRQRSAVVPQYVEHIPQARTTNAMANADLLRSWTSDAEFPQEMLAWRSHAADASGDALIDELIDEQLALVQPVGLRSDLRSQPLSSEDELTLHAAANVLAMLSQADLSSFADVERVRRIAEYDDLLNRLGEARGHVSAADRPIVLAAESILLRIVNGPLDLDDVRMMNETVAALDLAAQLEAMGGRWQTASSL